jgi:hypothetical protein
MIRESSSSAYPTILCQLVLLLHLLLHFLALVHPFLSLVLHSRERERVSEGNERGVSGCWYKLMHIDKSASARIPLQLSLGGIPSIVSIGKQVRLTTV